MPGKSMCQVGRLVELATKSNSATYKAKAALKPRPPVCENVAAPNRTYCEEHLLEAMSRLPDRSIGDRKGLRWGGAYA